MVWRSRELNAPPPKKNERYLEFTYCASDACIFKTLLLNEVLLTMSYSFYAVEMSRTTPPQTLRVALFGRKGFHLFLQRCRQVRGVRWRAVGANASFRAGQQEAVREQSMVHLQNRENGFQPLL